MRNIKKVVTVGEYMEGMPNDIVKTLTYDSIKPISIVGSFELHSSDCIVVMENKDVVEWTYKYDSVLKQEVNNISINGNLINLLNGGEDEDLCYDIRNYYRDHLMIQNKVV